jgi:integrase
MHESIQPGLALRARHSAVANRSVTELSRRGAVLRNVGTDSKLMQELLRHSSLRSTLDIYTQAITPAKRAAQRAVLWLVFSPEEDQSSSLEAPTPAET